MKILVTGGAGFIGSHIVDRLILEGHEVVVIDNLVGGRREQVNPYATFYQVDLMDPNLAEILQRERPQVISHQAAQINVSHSIQNPIEDATINILGSLKLLECARQCGVEKVIYASSGGAIYGEPDYLPCNEEHPIRPLSPYGVSKYAVEQYLLMYQQVYGINFTALRYGNVYGPRQNPDGEAGVVSIFSQRMLEAQKVYIFGTGEQRRDFIYVTDIAEANLLSIRKGDGQNLNIGTGVGTSVNEVFNRLQNVTSYEHQPVHIESRPGEVFAIHLAYHKAEATLNWRPKVTLLEGLERTVAFFRTQFQTN
jgi:UDP-glucose 4-epimerase